MNAEINNSDTICAISTPSGVGGIAVIRLSGPEAIDIVTRRWKGLDPHNMSSHSAHLGAVLDTDGQMLDQAVMTIFRSPRSYTGDDTVELSVHGSRYVQQRLVESLISVGARLAEPGEFTRRAYTSGNIDLARAEAVADIIASTSRAAHRQAIAQLRGDFSNIIRSLHDQLLEMAAMLELELDFSEEDVEFADRSRLLTLATEIHRRVTRLGQSFRAGQAIREGIPTAIVGPTNAGKSSLLNAMIGDDRAIVSDVHGTTRDTIQELLTIGDYQFRLIDTAGLRDTVDTIEQIGIERTRRAIADASVILAVIDNTQPLDTATLAATLPASNNQEDLVDTAPSSHDDITTPTVHYIVVLNKTDRSGVLVQNETVAREFIATLPPHISGKLIHLSAVTRQGIDTLTQSLNDIGRELTDSGNSDILVTNIRHAQALSQAARSAADTIHALQDGLTPDLTAHHLRQTIDHLAAITGDIPSTTVLNTIFSRFCIGK